jgi:Transposase IS116/IS110/IS902 family
VPVSSGRSDRHRLDRGGNRQLNLALHRLAVNRARLDPVTAAYLKRKQAEGKSRMEALRCLKRYLARRVYRLLTVPTQPLAVGRMGQPLSVSFAGMAINPDSAPPSSPSRHVVAT